MLSLHNLRSSSNTPETSRRSDNAGWGKGFTTVYNDHKKHYKEVVYFIAWGILEINCIGFTV